MPYSREHKTKSRERILNSALRMFSEGGFEQVTIDKVMTNAGLTRGAFYAHFSSKEELYAEAIHHGINCSALVNIQPDGEGLRSLRQLIGIYLSRAHVDGKAAPCPLAFFATDVGVRERRVRFRGTAVQHDRGGGARRGFRPRARQHAGRARAGHDGADGGRRSREFRADRRRPQRPHPGQLSPHHSGNGRDTTAKGRTQAGGPQGEVTGLVRRLRRAWRPGLIAGPQFSRRTGETLPPTPVIYGGH